MDQSAPLHLNVKNPGMKKLFPAAPMIETLSTGHKWPEGPLWLPSEEKLIFSDVSGNAMYSWQQGLGVTVFRKPSGYANGNTLDRMGRVVTCEHQNRRVSRTELDNRITALATSYQGKRLNSPNDVIVKSDGIIYFTDPPDGLTEAWGVPGNRELNIQGVYRISAEGTLFLEVEDFQTPNGLALSPDEKYIYVDDTDKMHVRRFAVNRDGSLERSTGIVFAELDPRLGPGWPDGMKVDMSGNLYVTGPTGIWIFDQSGMQLGIINIPITPTNLNWGGRDYTMLFVTAAMEDFSRSAVYRIQMNIAGHRQV